MTKAISTSTRARKSAALAKTPVIPAAPVGLTAEDRKGMSFTYEDTDFPETAKPGRKAGEPNPHTTGVAEAVKRHNEKNLKALSFTLENTDAEALEKLVKQNINWLRTAGQAANVTIRIETVKLDETHVKIIFRAIDKVTRARKSVVPAVAEVATAEQAGF